MITMNKPNSFLKDIRYCHAAWGILLLNNQSSGQQFFPTSVENFMLTMEQYRVNQDSQSFYSNLKRNCDNTLINKEKLSWINKNNPRACYFFYKKLTQTTTDDDLNIYLQVPILGVQLDNKIWMDTSATSIAEKTNSINQAIDCMNINKIVKERYIDDLKKMYASTLATNNFEWVIPNETLHEWFYSYMETNLLLVKNRNFITDSFIDNPLYSAIEIYDDWQPIHKSEKELFIIKLRKAYQQQSYRQNKAGKEKTYTYSMPLNIEDKMTEISRKLGVTRNKILTDLINEKHSSLCLGDRKQTKNII
jgi:hypothetical protein